MSPSRPDEPLVEQLRALVEEELRRGGHAQAVRVDGTSLLVGRGAALARAEVSGTIEQWPHLPEDLRLKRVQQIAVLLAPTTTAVAPPPRRSPRREPRRWTAAFAPLLIAGVTAAVLVFAYRTLAPGSAFLSLHDRAQSPSAASANLVDPDREREQLARIACDQTRARYSRGSSPSPADVEGWVVELVLLARTPGPTASETSAALAKFLRKKADSPGHVVVWSGAKALREVERFDAEVRVENYAVLTANGLSGSSFVFSGPYVTPYFSDAQRADYLMLADALSDALQASDGALFAHCVGSASRYLGSWFLGADPGAALTSLVFFMAAASEAPLVHADPLDSKRVDIDARPNPTYDVIATAAHGLDRSTTATLIGTELGMIAGRPNHPVRLSFPFRDANRATRASAVAARALKITNAN